MDYLWITVMFLSAVLTLILTAPIHWWSIGKQWCNAKFLQICSDEETNSFTSWMAWGWVYFQQMFIFEWTISLSLPEVSKYVLVAMRFVWFSGLKIASDTTLLWVQWSICGSSVYWSGERQTVHVFLSVCVMFHFDNGHCLRADAVSRRCVVSVQQVDSL